MKKNPEVEELQQFLASYSTSKIAADADLLNAVGRIYKRHRAILVWKMELDRGTLWRDTTREKTFRTYFAEAVSDLAQAFLLFYQGLYKPARLLLRSSVENFFRCICIADDINVAAITNTYDLIASAQKSNTVKLNDATQTSFSSLHQLYKELCKYVHSATESNLSLIEFLGGFPKFDGRSAPSVEKHIRSTMNNFNSILACMFHARLKRLHHRHSDIIFDVLPRLVRVTLSS